MAPGRGDDIADACHPAVEIAGLRRPRIGFVNASTCSLTFGCGSSTTLSPRDPWSPRSVLVFQPTADELCHNNSPLPVVFPLYLVGTQRNRRGAFRARRWFLPEITLVALTLSNVVPARRPGCELASR